MDTLEYLLAEEINHTEVGKLLSRAFIDFEVDSDGDLRVDMDNCYVIVIFDSERQLLRFQSYWRLNPDANFDSTLRMVNEMNDQVIMVRFAVPEKRSDVLVADYCMSYGGGMVSKHFITTLRLFERVAGQTVRRFDRDGLVA